MFNNRRLQTIRLLLKAIVLNNILTVPMSNGEILSNNI